MCRKAITIVLAAVLVLGLAAQAPATDQVLPEPERTFLRLINKARANPLKMAASIGLKPDRVLADFPDMYEVLTEGLPPLLPNETLRIAASAHTLDMLANNYYTHESLDGRTLEERLRDSGYYAFTPDESLGMLAFINFVQPTLAAELVFENMYKDELNPKRTEAWKILGPDMTEVGIGWQGGRFSFKGGAFNAYMTTLDFAAGQVSELVLGLLELINQARANPLEVAASLGLDPEQLLEDLPELHDVLIEGLPPLTFNEQLFAAASAHARDMLENDYFSHISPDGRTPEDRISEQGYQAEVTGEIIRLLATVDFTDPMEGARIQFEGIFRRELSPDCANRNILNPNMTEVGISYLAESPEIPEEEVGTSALAESPEAPEESEEEESTYDEYYQQVLVCDFAAPITREALYLKGQAYRDLNGDGLYSLGEGMAGVLISIEGPDATERYLLTDQAGGFVAAVEEGAYRVVAAEETGPVEQWVDVFQENEAVGFILPVEPGPDSADSGTDFAI